MLVTMTMCGPETRIEIRFPSSLEKLIVHQSPWGEFSERQFFIVIQYLEKQRVKGKFIVDLVENLEVSGTEIHQFPINMKSFVNLKRLFARNTLIREFPRSFFPHLASLCLSHNAELRTITPKIGEITTLKHLDFSYTPIKELPPEIGKLKALKYLNLSCTSIEKLLPEISKILKLEHLDLSYTPIKELPPEIGRLRALKCLDIMYTQISALPIELAKLSLKQINLHQIPYKKVVFHHCKQYNEVNVNEFSCFLLANLYEKDKTFICCSNLKTVRSINKFKGKSCKARAYWNLFFGLFQLAQQRNQRHSLVIVKVCSILPLIDIIANYCAQPFKNLRDHRVFFIRVCNYLKVRNKNSFSLHRDTFSEEMHRNYLFLREMPGNVNHKKVSSENSLLSNKIENLI